MGTTLYFHEIISFYEENIKIIELSIKQLSRTRFIIKNNLCETHINYQDNEITVIFTNNIEFRVFQHYVILFSNESSVKQLSEFLITFLGEKTDLFSLLNEYFRKYTFVINGNTDKVWFKFFSDTEPSDPMRNEYNVKWINYNKQLESSNIIYDENKLVGLFAIENLKTLYEAFSDTCKNRYGNQLFILAPVEGITYFKDENEIIGDSFKVLKKFNLKKFEEIGDLLEAINETLDSIHKKEISNIKKEKSDINEMYIKISREYSKINSNNISRVICGLLVGLVIGVFIGKYIL